MAEHSRPAGAVMAGGQSRRMGSDKAMLRLREDGPTLLERSLDVLRPVCAELLVVASDRPAYAGLGARQVPDHYPGAGPLGGIASALEASAEDHVIVVSCDMPFLAPGLIERLANTTTDADVVVPVLPGTNRQGRQGIYQTLCARYSRRCLRFIEPLIAQGRFQIVGFLDEVRVHELWVDELQSIDPLLRSFVSVNTPEALAEARAIDRELHR
jgi:molybdopterin-guanine dinucleotide biosynthesis protein A